MAFQAQTMNIAVVTGDLWPSLKSSIAKPLNTLRRGGVKIKRAGDHRAVSTAASSAVATRAPHSKIPESELPDFLVECSVQDLAILPVAGIQQGHALSAIPADVLRDANPYRYALPSSSTRPHSTSSLSRLLGKTSYRQVRKPNMQQSRSFTSAFSQNLLSHLERTANNNPRSASAQSAFYNALQKAGMPQIIVERFQTGRYASNQACEDIYKDAVEVVSKSEGSGDGLAAQTTRDIIALAAGRQTGNNTTKGRVTGGTGDKSSPVHVIIDESKKIVFFKYFKQFMWYGIVGYFLLTVCTVVIETGGFLKKGGVPNAEAQNQDQKVKFSDVHGCEEAKEELQELVDFLKNPEKFSALGGKLPKGVLLVGPPGTGKTLLARAVAGEAGVPFFYMSGSEFDEIYVGVGAKRVRELFGSARAKAPAIVFIDELDAIGAKRNERDPVYVKQSLNQLLTELDGFTQETGVIILGATNFPQLLDKALTRPGRFDRNVEVPLPDVRGRMNIIKHYMKKIKADPDVDPTLIARGTTGFSGAQLESLVNQAAVRASKNRTSTVTMLDMEWAKDKILMGAEKRSMVVKPADKLLTAYHEAGHALVALHTKGATPIYKVTVMPRGMSLGLTMRIPEMDKLNSTREELRAHLDVCLGGKAAEEIVGGDDSVTTGCSSDLQGATSVAKNMITAYGMSSKLGPVDLHSKYNSLSTETRLLIESEVRSMIESAHLRATNLLNTHRDELDILAKALVEYEVLSLDEIKRVLKGEKLQKLKAGKNAPMAVPEIVVPTGGPGVRPLGGAQPEGLGSGQQGAAESGASTPTTPGQGAKGEAREGKERKVTESLRKYRELKKGKEGMQQEKE